MSKQDEIVRIVDAAETTQLPQADDLEIGQWYWVKDSKRIYDEENDRWTDEYEDYQWLGCVVEIGSNYVEVKSPGIRGNSFQRVHFDEFDEQLTRENDPDSVINGNVAKYQARVRELMGNIRQLTAKLGITPRGELSDQNEEQTQALVAVHGTDNVKEHKAALIKAKEETLPDLFEKMKKANEKVAMWMQAALIPLEAEADALKERTNAIEDRIFTVTLYAGLTEELVKVKDGEPASNEDKIHLFQRRHYMDEECLVDYDAGGMDYKSVRQFDKWLCRKRNLNRILPHERCVVAFRIRRSKKDREASCLTDFINFSFEEDADKQTFLYIRNGEQVYRLATDIEFDEQLFPDRSRGGILGSGQLYMDTYFHECRRVIGEQEYQDILARRKERWERYEAELAAWEKLSKAEKKRRIRPWEPDRHGGGERWEPVQPESVYYDDAMKLIAREAVSHNRIAVVLQGLLDRSPAFHPHPPWRLWTPEGFSAGLELVYDDTRALTDGDPPDFEAYRQRLNASITRGTHTVGQQDVWERVEAEKENQRQHADYRIRYPLEYKRYKPYGNPGPGLVAEVTAMSRDGQKCSFQWKRERQRTKWVPDPNNYRYMIPDETKINTRFKCPIRHLLNVDAYTPGDYKQFYEDPRTRENYLKWAPLLLAAEDWHAKKKNKK